MDLHTYPDRDMLMMRLADRISADLKECLLTHDRATLCAPGGTTPGPVFDLLSAVDLDWSRVDVLLNDERWVPETSERSNTALLRQRLLTGRAAAARLIPLVTGDATPEEGLAALTEGLEGVLPISVLLLGMGEDMHTASLFPGADQLDFALSDNAPPLIAMRAPGAAEPRITLSAPVLRDAMKTHLLIVGPGKKAALEQADRPGPVREAPVRAILGNAMVHWAA
ncbi:putative 6-phosphogluconolactonase [Dinoroseobacter shibae DFL 12 = DSM 16493]|jgi:6-phosphogluconolactonase|uniref:6-phosphogluconolactonase n=1 Tax=Dinoroseobacter shibae (strain DSM 16493 / NCIMB 14021 / DFL 12) TaxID=398580 RepID=A8LLP7_DINSH|nr:6-phosphogluconolactonase [Dinoroseobacter shibae]ABV93425.1 putative 6-phosphogluconolactonase [Dinoroseobacter shibae DFL 12 = DSM 16493]URF48339.1 6-phosphogluconolactonase [Dinoroseobacter shibae]URF52649.1 6-phosphogluconolactonase [Dinoroseobacter shibae]